MPTAIVTAGSVLTATEFNKLPRGLVAFDDDSTQFTTSGTHTNFQDNGLSVSVSWVSGRSYRVTYGGHLYPSGGQNRMRAKIVRGSTDLKEYYLPSEAVSTTSGFDVVYFAIYQPSSSATETVKVQIASGGTNTAISDYGDSTRRRYLMIEDLGIL